VEQKRDGFLPIQSCTHLCCGNSVDKMKGVTVNELIGLCFCSHLIVVFILSFHFMLKTFLQNGRPDNFIFHLEDGYLQFKQTQNHEGD